MSSIASIAATLQEHLIRTAEQAARDHGCVQRVRQFSGATLLQTLILGFLEDPDASLSRLCELAQTRGVLISPQGLEQRFTPQLVATLEVVLAEIVETVCVGTTVPLAVLERFAAVWVLDATTISLPRALATVWAGCGGNPGQGTAAVKAVLAVDLLRGRLAGPILQDGRLPDQRSVLCQRTPVAGALWIHDLAYFNLSRFREADLAGEYWLSRLKANTTVTTLDGHGWKQADLLRSYRGTIVDMPVMVGRTEQLPVRFLAIPVPKAIARERKAQLHKEARRKGQSVSQSRLQLADWTILVTNLPVDMLSPAEAVVLLRARWQIEQLFHLWKTYGGLDRSRSQQPWRVLAELYAKLIAMVLQHWLVVIGTWQIPDRSMIAAARMVRTHARQLGRTIDTLRTLKAELAILQAALARVKRIAKRRHRPGTVQQLVSPPELSLT